MDRSLYIIRCIFLLSLLPMLLTGCSGGGAEHMALEDAERLMDCDPDSAHAILRTVDFDRLSDADDRDRYRLLSLCAGLGDRNDPATDSLLSVITERHYSDDMALLAFQTAGIYYMEQRNYPLAMRHFLRADKLASEKGDWPKAAQIRTLMTDVNDSVFNSRGVVEFGLQAFRAYDLCGDSMKMYELGNRILLDLIDKREFAAADEIAGKVLHIAQDQKDHVFEFFATSYLEGQKEDSKSRKKMTLAEPIMIMGEEDSLMVALRKLKDGDVLVLPDNLGDYPQSKLSNLVNDLWNDGEYVKARKLIDAVKERYSVLDSENGFGGFKSLSRRWIAMRIPGSRYTEAYEKPTSASFMNLFRSGVDTEVRGFEQAEKIARKKELEYHRTLLILASALFLTVVAIIVYFTRLKIKRQRCRVAEVMDMSRELNRNFRKAQGSLFRVYSNLCDAYYNSYVKSSGSPKGAKEALKAIEDFSKSPETFSELEEYLDSVDGRLMARFREQMPGLRDDEYRLFLCNALGFSVPTISLLLDEKREVIYNRRLRLRAKILSAAPPDADLFVGKLG